MHERYYVELAKQEKLLSRKNEKSDFYNGVFDRYVNPVLTRDMIPLTWRYDLNEETNPFFMERLGINAVMNSGAIYLNGNKSYSAFKKYFPDLLEKYNCYKKPSTSPANARYSLDKLIKEWEIS